ncbi:MAG TPA: YggS family pyridoxal phosphate-dependent enzyme [Tenuifilaceae bacterium]|jgi:pyridoxal phosphate enzyme (YggS family)|nr:YggS family pyridoxal phosphate-dependent enzyme [Tenuifilaceae bacterium]HPX05106.1 YggS family pyridoxal phosphate-dependent enzyme [Tenuifilaceae bacterium]
MSVSDNLNKVKQHVPSHVTLVAISKTHPVDHIMEAYNAGQRVFGENKVQEMVSKQEVMPKDIQWHLVGHLQSNKIKYIAPFVTLIHSVDSLKLLVAINKEAVKANRVIDCLLQVYIAEEETKFGLSVEELTELLESEEYKQLTHVRVCGVMGMATFTDNEDQIRKEFKSLKTIFTNLKNSYFPNTDSFRHISMGMSGDYAIAIEEGSTMIRVGSSIFGHRAYNSN